MTKRDFLLRNLLRLRLDRLLVLEEPITDAVADRLITRILELAARDRRAEISFLVASPGGEVKPGLAIYEAMRVTTCDVMTVCVGPTASMAAILLAAGTAGKRVALSAHARVTLHPPWRNPFDDGVSDPEPEMSRIHGLVYQILAGLTGRTPAAVADDARRQLTLDAVEARSYGLVDQVDCLPPGLS